MGIDLKNPLHVLGLVLAVVIVLWVAGGIIGWAIDVLIVIAIVGGIGYALFLAAKAFGVLK